MIKQYSFCALHKAKVIVAQKYKCKLYLKKSLTRGRKVNKKK